MEGTVDPQRWGVDAGYHDAAGQWREPSPEALDRILGALGAGPGDPPPVDDLWVVRAGDAVDPGPGGRAEIVLEDGGRLTAHEPVTGLPLGYHRLLLDRPPGSASGGDRQEIRLIVSPGRCHLPPNLHTWGWAVQLYAARSHGSWGIGDLADLRRLATWSGDLGAGFLLLNPLHAATPVAPQQPSPYYPSSRCFRSPLYLRVEEVPGAGAAGVDIDGLAAAGRALNDDRAIDRDRVLALKLEALERIWGRAGGAAGFDGFSSWVEGRGRPLQRWARYCAIAERHGASWSTWPAELQDPDGAAVDAAAGELADRVAFHAWLQWLVESQLEAASGAVDLVQDLAVGVDPGGADAWIWQDVFVAGMSVGAPPDEYNTQGQDWGLPPFDPWALRRAHFEPFIETVRAGFRHAGGIRVDHVMGLFRLFWVPEGMGPADGTYVRYPWQEMLDILALESARAGAWVVGEDLGTVEPWVRDELQRRDVLSYRLLWFEPERPRQYPERALAAVTTHDLPTTAGLWSGQDLRDQEARGMVPNVESTSALRRRLRDWTGVDDDAPVDEVVTGVHGLLAEAPSMLVTATLEDPLAVPERPNYPGTVGGTNWSLALPVAIEEIEHDERVHRVARALAERS